MAIINLSRVPIAIIIVLVSEQYRNGCFLSLAHRSDVVQRFCYTIKRRTRETVFVHKNCCEHIDKFYKVLLLQSTNISDFPLALILVEQNATVKTRLLVDCRTLIEPCKSYQTQKILCSQQFL